MNLAEKLELDTVKIEEELNRKNALLKYQTVEPESILEKKFESFEDVVSRELKQFYEFRNNIVTGKIEYREKNWNYYTDIDDRVVNTITHRIKRKDGFFDKLTTAKINEILDSDFTENFDPFRAYFSSLEWDKKTDYVRKLTSLVSAKTYYKNGYEVNPFIDFFYRWAVACVACAYDNKPNHTGLILTGGQGVGKSTFFEKICPGFFTQPGTENKYYTIEPEFDGHNKDNKISISDSFIINIDEMANFSKKDMGKR